MAGPGHQGGHQDQRLRPPGRRAVEGVAQAGGEGPAQGPAGLSAHAPDSASATYGPVTLAAGGGIQIQAGTLRFQESPWDGVDAVGSVTVSNLAGTELLVAYVSGFFASGGISPVALTLSEGGSIGSDLAVVGNTITSTAGGLFLVTLNAQAEWD